MSNSIDLWEVNKLINKKFFIPTYQRGYRWDVQQVEDLLNDLYEFKNSANTSAGEFYCLQPIVVKKRGDLYDVIGVNESDKSNEEGCLKFFAFGIKKETICQYTGLTDKTGKRIFEGDIVSGLFAEESIKGYIKYGSNALYYIERSGLFGIHLDNAEDWLEVAGNIFDNPEMLGGAIE